MGSQRLRVDCQAGTAEGLADVGDGVAGFFGMPFTEPAGGERRFQPPLSPVSWPGTLDATDFGPSAAHLYDRHEGTLEDFGETDDDPERIFVGGEGSLTLNIWTPGCDARRRPTVIFIHGGANWVGSSRLPLYHGDRLARRCDVVFVSFNYRLGMLGFMEFGAFGGPDYRGSHANGLRDQLAAILWVRENIAAFGGDPERITLMGESAGSIDITWLMASGALSGLTRRVILMSGIGGNRMRHDYSIAGGEAAADRFLEAADIQDMPSLLSLDTRELMERHRRAFSKLHVFEQSMFTPRVDGDFIAQCPIAAAHSGAFAEFEILLGYTSFEMGLYLLYDPDLAAKPYEQQLHGLNIDPEHQRQVIDVYDRVYGDDPQGIRGMRLLSDIWYVMPSLVMAEALSQFSESVWVYEFAWQNSASPLGAAHATDLCFWFDKLETEQAKVLLGSTGRGPERQRRNLLAQAMQNAIGRFAHGEQPQSPLLAGEWRPYSRAARNVLVIDERSRLICDPRKETREWWSENQCLIWD
ncbi:carboxylesterase/lipase family protein [Elongatibacter sediminis]|uniref:Carboxylic ester hydrolase n=1 Tax=Elongatibacter sediminis TaxID=3119006 RepID=A0AAW9R973_9GAMM